jgi:hypothetical protein
MMTRNRTDFNVQGPARSGKRGRNFLPKVIRGGENGYDPEMKQQSSQWKSSQSPHAKKAQQVRSTFKSMLIFSFTVREFFTLSLFLEAKLNQQEARDDVRRKTQTSGAL